MVCRESNAETDYIYFPIEYPNKALSTTSTVDNINMGTFYTPWLTVVDKSKFLTGIYNDYIATAEQRVFNVISVGF